VDTVKLPALESAALRAVAEAEGWPLDKALTELVREAFLRSIGSKHPARPVRVVVPPRNSQKEVRR